MGNSLKRSFIKYPQIKKEAKKLASYFFLNSLSKSLITTINPKKIASKNNNANITIIKSATNCISKSNKR
jgi:hypothetical protein